MKILISNDALVIEISEERHEENFQESKVQTIMSIYVRMKAIFML